MRAMLLCTAALYAALAPGRALCQAPTAAPAGGGKVRVELVADPAMLKANEALARPVTISLNGVPVGEALKQVADMAGLPLSADLDDPDPAEREKTWRRLGLLDGRVRVEATEAPVSDVIERILGTVGLRYEVVKGRLNVVGAKGKGPAHPEPGQARAARDQITKQLAKPVTVQFDDITFADVVAFLTDITGINIVLDDGAEGARKKPIVVRMANAAASDVLSAVVGQVNMEYVVSDGAVIISDPATVALKRLKEAMSTRVSLSMERQPFAEVLLHLNDLCGANVSLDPDAAAALPKMGQTPVTVTVKDVPAREAYRFLATLLGLKFEVKDGQARFAAGGKHPALPPPPADPILGRIVVRDEKTGATTELYIRKSDMPEDLKRLRDARIKDLIKRLREEAKRTGDDRSPAVEAP